MIQIHGDSNGYIELRPGQSWVVPGISVYVKITHARWVDSSHSFVKIQIGDKQYGVPVTQKVWYNVGDIQFNADVQIRLKRLNHIQVNVPDSWGKQLLDITAMDVIQIPADNVPSLNRYGVGIGMRLEGSGTKNLKIDWGTDYSETKTGLIAGFYEFKETLPPGTHNVCAVLF